jgi:hypothetical protein
MSELPTPEMWKRIEEPGASLRKGAGAEPFRLRLLKEEAEALLDAIVPMTPARSADGLKWKLAGVLREAEQSRKRFYVVRLTEPEGYDLGQFLGTRKPKCDEPLLLYAERRSGKFVWADTWIGRRRRTSN